MNQQDIEQVVKAVLLKMKDSSQPATAVHEMGVFASLDDAVAAGRAWRCASLPFTPSVKRAKSMPKN